MTTQLIGWTLIHSLWQGGLIAVGLPALLWLTRRGASSTRYLLAIGALALMVALPVATAACAL